MIAGALAGLLLPLGTHAEGPQTGRADLVATILARPLFTPGRRPRAPSSTATAAPAPPPHLIGIIVSGQARVALFATPNLRPVSVVEGAQIDGYLVKTISQRDVGLAAPSGNDVTLVPRSDPAARSALLVAAPGPIPLVDPFRRESDTETDQ